MITKPLPLEHEHFCLARPGESEPRIESYRAERVGQDGITVVSRPLVTRCLECGSQRIDG